MTLFWRRLREERLQRIARYKSRLALLLPPLVEQFRNDTAPRNWFLQSWSDTIVNIMHTHALDVEAVNLITEVLKPFRDAEKVSQIWWSSLIKMQASGRWENCLGFLLINIHRIASFALVFTSSCNFETECKSSLLI
jgi:hypothetical protein